MTNSKRKIDVRAVLDTHIFVPAIVGCEAEAGFYNKAISICWKLVFSEQIAEEYKRLINRLGYRSEVVIHETNKIYAMTKYRLSIADPNAVPDELAPRKDRHLVAPCIEGKANMIVTNDGGLHERKEAILRETGARVLYLHEAQQMIDS